MNYDPEWVEMPLATLKMFAPDMAKRLEREGQITYTSAHSTKKCATLLTNGWVTLETIPDPPKGSDGLVVRVPGAEFRSAG